MASKKFEKGSAEWEMFTSFWQLCQRFWMPEDNAEHVGELCNAARDFQEKHGVVNGAFVKDISTALSKQWMRKESERRERGEEKREIGKIYTEKFACRCGCSPCDHFESCKHPRIWYATKLENGIKVREYCREFDFSGGVTFKNYCKRNDKELNMKWNDGSLKEWISSLCEKYPDSKCDFEKLKTELKELGLWEEK